MKICYISSTFFSDSDLGILQNLATTNEVCYGIVVPYKNNNFSTEELDRCVYSGNSTLVKQEVILKRRTRNPLNILSYIKWVKTLKVNKYDIVYINHTEDFFLSMVLCLFIQKKFFIYGVHDALGHGGLRTNFLMKKANEMLITRSRSLLAFSNSQSNILLKGFPKKEVFTIPLALKHFGDSNEIDSNCDTIQFLFFGNIAAYKGLDILLKAVKNLSRKYKNFGLTIAGRCPDWDTTYLPMIDNEMPVDAHIRFIDNSEIAGFFSNAHYLVLPYKDVTQSGPLMIAYNYDMPVLASKLDGFEEFLDEGKSGYFFKSESVEELTSAMELSILRTKEEYVRLKRSTSAYAKNRFGIEAISAQYMQMFNEVASKVV